MREEREELNIKKTIFLYHCATVLSYLWDSTVALWQIFLRIYMFPCSAVEHFGPHMLKFSYICHINAQLRMLYKIFQISKKKKIYIYIYIYSIWQNGTVFSFFFSSLFLLSPLISHVSHFVVEIYLFFLFYCVIYFVWLSCFFFF